MSVAAEIHQRIVQGQVLSNSGDWISIPAALAEQRSLLEHINRGEIETSAGWMPLPKSFPQQQANATRTVVSDTAPPSPGRIELPHEAAVVEELKRQFLEHAPTAVFDSTGAVQIPQATPNAILWSDFDSSAIPLQAKVHKSSDTPPVFRIAPMVFLDQSTAPHLRELLTLLLEQQPRGCILDLKETSYISSAGWGVMAAANRLYTSAGTHLVLCDVGEQTAESLKLLQLDKVVRIFNTSNEAHAFLASRIENPQAERPRQEPADLTAGPVAIPEMIKRVIADYGPISAGTLQKTLREPRYGAVSLSRLKLFGLLRSMNLDSRSQQERFYRSC